MSLEEDIQQKAFGSEYHKVILNILHTQNHLVGGMTEVFKQFDITRQQYNVLRILKGRYPQPASVNLIKERMLEKMSDSSRIVERLRLKGMSRVSDKNDKRSVEVSITEEGLDLLQKMKDPIGSLESLISHLTIDEARQLNGLLDKLRRADSLPGDEKLSPALEHVNQPEKI
jgi:DNA-binding MarR family transcriptional regulator